MRTCSNPVKASFFFFNDTATTEIYTLSLHDALPIFVGEDLHPRVHVGDDLFAEVVRGVAQRVPLQDFDHPARGRSEEHTSELQSQSNLVCRLLLEKKKKETYIPLPESTTL